MAEQRPRKPAKSQKLGRTLEEIESAFTDWESLSSTSIRKAQIEEELRKSKLAAPSTPSDQEFVQKTKKLLSQLRDQLSELTD